MLLRSCVDFMRSWLYAMSLIVSYVCGLLTRRVKAVWVCVGGCMGFSFDGDGEC